MISLHPMSILIPEKDLPQDLTAEQAVEAAYAAELADVASRLQRGLPVLIECDKDLGPFLYMNLRNRLKQVGLHCLYLDGRPGSRIADAMPAGFMGTMITQLRDAVRGGRSNGASSCCRTSICSPPARAA